jgi:hypothetical protein
MSVLVLVKCTKAGCARLSLARLDLAVNAGDMGLEEDCPYCGWPVDFVEGDNKWK